MITGKYIRMLLDERKRVILPGFGNLEVKSPEGAETPSGSRINPPGISVRFDAGYSKDDGLLAGVISSGEEIESEEALQRVLELVDAIKFALDKGEDFLLAGAGSFSRDEDGKIHFMADPDWVLEPELYGLESMDLLELDELPPEEEPVEEPVTETQSSPKVTPLAAPVPQRGARRWRVIWVVAIVLIVVLVVLILIPPADDENGNEKEGIFKKKPKREVVEKDKPSRNQQESETATKVVAPEPETPEPEVEADQPVPVVENNKYFIVAGSFKNLRNASDLQDKLKARGFPAEVMITENRMYRVSVASYADKEEAEKGLLEITSQPGLQSCWLLSN
jgi:cell division septation protein DedD/nucleoid DNA-binding protein